MAIIPDRATSSSLNAIGPAPSALALQFGRQDLRLAHHIAEQAQAQLPEAWVRDVHAQSGEQPMRGVGAAGRKQTEVARHKSWTLLLVLLHERQHEQFAESVSVAVKGDVDEMADVEPPPRVAFAE